MTRSEADGLLRSWFDTAISTVAADEVLPPYLPAPPTGRTFVLAVGKGASAMAGAFVRHWHHPFKGLIITRYGHLSDQHGDLGNFEVIEASHPIPDENSLAGGLRALELAHELGPDDLLIALISGGGSALMAAPVSGVSLTEKGEITTALMTKGATIRDINCVRKHLSVIKGGRLADAAAPARVVTLAIADVVGDDPALIASGPTVTDASTLAQARDVLKRFDIPCPDAVQKALTDPENESLDLQGAQYSNNICHVVAAPGKALSGAARAMRAMGYDIEMLGDLIEGEARTVAEQHAALARRIESTGRPTVILSGGELTVSVRGGNAGKGGPNTEYVLALARALNGAPGIFALACDTDGKDGTGDNAGALIGPETLAKAKALGLSVDDALERNDSYTFFRDLDDLVITGPTNTNVNDFRAILINPA